MTLLSLYIILIALNFVFPKSKILIAVNLLYMWLLMGWSYGNADYGIYTMRYLHPEIYGTLEPLYVAIQNVFSSSGYDYPVFLIVMSGICLLIRVVLICKMSVNPNMVFAFYLVFPFIMDIVQIRMFYASTFVLVGIYVLLYCKSRWIIPGYIAIIFVATMIHVSCVFYVLFLVAKILDKEKIWKYSRKIYVSVAILTVLLISGALYRIGIPIANMLGFGDKFTQTVAAADMAYSINNRLVYMFEIVIFYALTVVVCKRARVMLNTKRKSTSMKRPHYISQYNSTIDFCDKANRLLLFVLPFAWLSGDVYRLQHSFAIIVYIMTSNVVLLGRKCAPFSKRRFKIVAYTGCLAIVFMILFTLLIPSLRDYVFFPAFFKNTMIG